MDEKKPYRGLTIEFKSKGLDEFSDQLREVNDVAKELEATLEHVTSLIERISLANYETPSIGEVSRRLYELEKESLKTSN